MKWRWRNDRRSERNLCNCVQKPEKNFTNFHLQIIGHIWLTEKFAFTSDAYLQARFRNVTSGIYAKYHVQIMLLFVYTTTRKRFVTFTCRYFKSSWNTTALSQSNYRNFSCSSINNVIRYMPFKCVCTFYLFKPQLLSSRHWRLPPMFVVLHW